MRFYKTSSSDTAMTFFELDSWFALLMVTDFSKLILMFFEHILLSNMVFNDKWQKYVQIAKVRS
jgi:hypothetical protein